MRKNKEITQDCETCANHGTMDCPTSALCYSKQNHPYWINKPMKENRVKIAISGIPLDRLEAICAAERDGRLVALPVGKIGDVVEWDSGVCKELFQIRGIVIYTDGTRYDLGEFMPFANDEHICRIIPRVEAEKALGKEAQS